MQLELPIMDPVFPTKEEAGFMADKRFFDFSAADTTPLGEAGNLSSRPEVCPPWIKADYKGSYALRGIMGVKHFSIERQMVGICSLHIFNQNTSWTPLNDFVSLHLKSLGLLDIADINDTRLFPLIFSRVTFQHEGIHRDLHGCINRVYLRGCEAAYLGKLVDTSNYCDRSWTNVRPTGIHEKGDST